MKEHPINLEAWEVRAILEGRKTQFRRIVNPQPNCESCRYEINKVFLSTGGNEYNTARIGIRDLDSGNVWVWVYDFEAVNERD